MENKCENCIHFDVCLEIEKSLKAISNCISIEHTGCEFFKDKFLCVELPCKVGDKVYCINDIDTQIEECEIVGFGFNKVHKEVFMLDKDGAEYYANEFGKYYFLTKEDAERKLSEVEQ